MLWIVFIGKDRVVYIALSEVGHPQVPEYKESQRPKTRNEANEAKRVPASMTGCAFYPMISAWDLVKCNLRGFPCGSAAGDDFRECRTAF